MSNETIDEILNEMFENDENCGLSEIVGAVCGNSFYDNYDEEDLSYVKEVLMELTGVIVDFDLEREEMYVVSVLE
jgi:hypothetical protein